MIRARGLELLMPWFRDRLTAVMAEIAAAKLPLRVFETVRSPARQEELYKRGRDPKAADFGRTVTKARAYQSAHQFGQGADVVGWVNGAWTWDLPASTWKRFGQIARSHDLVQLSFEQPHLQPAGWDWHGIAHGPLDDQGWLDWLRARANEPEPFG